MNNIVCDPEKKSEGVGFSPFVQLLKVTSKLLPRENAIRVRNFVFDGTVRSCLFLVAESPGC